MTLSKNDRCRLAERLAREAGALGLDYFTDLKTLQVDRKGHQDLVSEADKALEKHIRGGIATAFPQDGILGEEDEVQAGENDCVWVIDPMEQQVRLGISGLDRRHRACRKIPRHRRLHLRTGDGGDVHGL